MLIRKLNRILNKFLDSNSTVHSDFENWLKNLKLSKFETKTHLSQKIFSFWEIEEMFYRELNLINMNTYTNTKFQVHNFKDKILTTIINDPVLRS